MKRTLIPQTIESQAVLLGICLAILGMLTASAFGWQLMGIVGIISGMIIALEGMVLQSHREEQENKGVLYMLVRRYYPLSRDWTNWPFTSRIVHWLGWIAIVSVAVFGAGYIYREPESLSKLLIFTIVALATLILYVFVVGHTLPPLTNKSTD